MPKTARRRQYGWRTFRGDTCILYTGGSAIQLEHGKRYQVAFEERRSGKCTAVVSDGFVTKRFNYNDKAAFEKDWVHQRPEHAVFSN